MNRYLLRVVESCCALIGDSYFSIYVFNNDFINFLKGLINLLFSPHICIESSDDVKTKLCRFEVMISLKFMTCFTSFLNNFLNFLLLSSFISMIDGTIYGFCFETYGDYLFPLILLYEVRGILILNLLFVRVDSHALYDHFYRFILIEDLTWIAVLIQSSPCNNLIGRFFCYSSFNMWFYPNFQSAKQC